MRICIPTADERGLDSRLYDHFGSAPYYAVVDTESGDVDMVRNTGHHHGHGHCRPIAHIDTSRAEAVVCQGMGKRAVASLEKGGVEVWVTSADTVRDAVTGVRDGTLKKLSVEAACGGRGGREHHRGG